MPDLKVKCPTCQEERIISRAMRNLIKREGTSGQCQSCSSIGNINRYKGEIYDRNLYQSPTYRVWQNMNTRCFNKKVHSFAQYGGRGIQVCKEWRSFKGFFDDMGERPNGLTLDRIDNSKGYSKANCRWATPKEQALNTRNVERAYRITFNGETKTIREWAEAIGVKRGTLAMRLQKYNWPIERALTT